MILIVSGVACWFVSGGLFLVWLNAKFKKEQRELQHVNPEAQEREVPGPHGVRTIPVERTSDE